MAKSEERIIALIDMDCFFCQVESRERPELKGKPMVVAGMNMILAVSYEAKKLGVNNRLGRADEAKEKFPELIVVSTPFRGKGDISKYRSAGQEVINVLKERCSIVERASIDEAFLDITKLVEERMESTILSSELEETLINTYVVGYCDVTNDEDKRKNGVKSWIKETFDEFSDDQNRKLAVAGSIVEELRAEIFEKCDFRCSAGISYNKVLAKLACGLHKPNKQTILPMSSVPELYSTLPVKKVRNLGGKIGDTIVEKLGCNVMADLLRFPLKDLQKVFDEKNGLWLFNIARGIDYEQVIPRLLCKSIGASKILWGDEVIKDSEKLKEWIKILATDVSERLEQDFQENHRRATTLTISYQYSRDKKNISQSRASALTSYKTEKIENHAYEVIMKSMQTPIVCLSITATKFVESQANFVNYFRVKHDTVDQTLQIDELEEDYEKVDDILNSSLNENENVNSAAMSEDGGKLVKLQEIFPDLDNIDASIVEFLPIELRDEAQTYLQAKNNIEKANEIKTNVKSTSKSKSRKSEDKNVQTIQNFFVVKSTKHDESSLIRCDNCNRMIEGEKYLEHCDFHVAQNLQKNINQLSNNTTECNSKRSHENGNTSKPQKKPRMIDSYFCK